MTHTNAHIHITLVHLKGRLKTPSLSREWKIRRGGSKTFSHPNFFDTEILKTTGLFGENKNIPPPKSFPNPGTGAQAESRGPPALAVRRPRCSLRRCVVPPQRPDPILETNAGPIISNWAKHENIFLTPYILLCGRGSVVHSLKYYFFSGGGVLKGCRFAGRGVHNYYIIYVFHKNGGVWLKESRLAERVGGAQIKGHAKLLA